MTIIGQMKNDEGSTRSSSCGDEVKRINIRKVSEERASNYRKNYDQRPNRPLSDDRGES